MSMVSLQPILASLLESLPPRPIDQGKLDELVKNALETSRVKSSVENRKSQWEYLLKNEIFLLAATEGQALLDEETTYYDALKDKLDLVLTFTEHDACEQTFPFIVLQDLLEMQTIASCSHVFSWIEARAARLTDGMVPQKGKALILLRTLNDLLRRLSKMGSTTIFCGRILTFLSGVFPLGERSGVNLRGEYGPTWEGVKDITNKKPVEKVEEVKADQVKEVKESADTKESKGVEDLGSQSDRMDVDAKEVKKAAQWSKSSLSSEKKEDFYNTFWSLQLPFSKPPLFAAPETFAEFQEAVNKVLPVIKEATAKERAMMGSRAGAGPSSLKRKREPDVEETSTNEYFFAKFLTSPDLIDLEIADTHFRRQFIFQLLILLNHLLTFTKTNKATWSSARNRSLQMDFVLETAETQWVQETINKAMEELRQTTPNGRAFAETANVIIEREKNWVKWKNELCAPFDKEPWSVDIDGRKVGLLEATRNVRQRMREPPPDWKWRLGTEPLTEIWDMGCRGLDDLQNPFQPGDVKDFVKKIKQENARIDLRKQNLEKIAERITQAKARAATPAKPADVTMAEKEPETTLIQPQEPPPTVDATSLTLPAPHPSVTNQAGSPLHPSLPAKPGSSPVKPPSSSSPEIGRNLTPIPPPAIPIVAPSSPAVVATPVPGPAPAPSEPAPAPTDEQILKFEENKQRWAWLALRTARDQHLQHFGRIGTGDIELLAKEIELEKEKAQKSEEIPGVVNVAGTADEPGIESSLVTKTTAPPVTENGQGGVESLQKPNSEGDVKMEDG